MLRPTTEPITQLLGSGFGHIGSTEYMGACTVARDCADVAICRTYWATASTAMTAKRVMVVLYWRFILLLKGV